MTKPFMNRNRLTVLIVFLIIVCVIFVYAAIVSFMTPSVQDPRAEEEARLQTVWNQADKQKQEMGMQVNRQPVSEQEAARLQAVWKSRDAE